MPGLTLNRRHKFGLFLVLVAAGISLLLEATVKQTAGAVVLGIAAAWAFGSLSPRTLAFFSCSLACAAGLSLAGVPMWQDWNSYKALAQDYDSAISKLRDAVAKTTVEPPLTLPADFFEKQNQMVNTLRQDREFMSAKSPADQKGYVAYLDPKFKKLSPSDQDGMLAYITGKVPGRRTVQIPEAARKWMRPGAIEKWKQPDIKDSKWIDRTESAWVNVTTGDPDPRYAYPADVSTDEMVKYIQSNDLLPRPVFSVGAALDSHRMTSIVGLTFVIAGLLGDGFLFLRLRRSRREA